MDVELDISMYLRGSYLGIEKGLPLFLSTLKNYNIEGDFFVTGDVCKRFPQAIKGICDEGNNIGCHGYDHTVQYYCKKNYEWQYEDISKATKVIEKITLIRPIMFRAPNFSTDGNTIKVLERLNYEIDSSILPGRVVRKWKVIPLIDFRSAPREPYHPSSRNIVERGNSRIVEIPITENPLSQGGPIGMGYLNYYGLERTINAIKKVNSNYVIFLVHPWELVNLRKYHLKLPECEHKLCSDDISTFIELLDILMKDYSFSTLEEQLKLAMSTEPN